MTRLALPRRRKSRPSHHRRTRLLVEPLESRRLLAVVSSWKGDGDAVDSVGPNHGTMLNGATFGTGLFGQGFEFDGIDDQFTAPTAGLPSGADSRTVELWTRLDAQDTAESFFASYGDTTPGAAFALGRLNDGRGFVSNWGNAIAAGSLNFGAWHHVAATLEPGNLFRLYLDGVEVASGTMSVSTPAGSTFYLGQQAAPFGADRKLDGLADEVRVHDQALTASEIQANFLAGGTGTPTAANDTYNAFYETTLIVAGPGVLANDSGQLAVLDSGPANGTVALHADGGFTYTPAAGYSGPDSFTYYAANGAGNSNLATVSIEVAPPGWDPLDPAFDTDGMVSTDVGGGRWDAGRDVAIQADGKIVVAEAYNDARKGDEFAVARYHADGSLDTTFGSGGIVRTSFGNKSDQGMAVGIQADGKIVVGGFATVSNKFTFAVARYNVNGSLDTTFDGDGKVTTNVGSGNEEIRDIVIQPDGKIVAAGYAQVSGGADFALVRYNPNGSLDAAFGVGGIVVTPGTNDVDAVALAPDGKIVASGNVIARYLPNGSLDTTFSGNGIIENRTGNGVAVQSDGKIVVADDAAREVVRFDVAGNLDPTFAGDGAAFAHIDLLYDVAVQADGKIVATGQGVFGGDVLPMMVLRLNAEGTPDASFGTGGLAEAAFPNSFASVGRRLAIQPDGKIVAAGFTSDGAPNGNWNFAVARFLGEQPAAATGGATDADVALMLFLADSTTRRKRK